MPARSLAPCPRALWMVLLYPSAHPHTSRQRREITEYVYRRLFARRKPLWQDQDHLVIYRGVRGEGLA